MRLAVAARAYERARKTGLEASCHHQGRSAGARAAFLGLLCGCTYLPCSAAFVACPSHNSKGSSNAGTKVSAAFLLARVALVVVVARSLAPALAAGQLQETQGRRQRNRRQSGRGSRWQGGGGAGGKEAEEQAAKLVEKQARNRHRLILIVSNHCHAYFCDLIFKHIFYIQEQNCAAQAAAAAAAAASQQFWT